MRAYTAWPGRKEAGLKIKNIDSAPLGPNEVRVRIRGVSLNYRDLMIVYGEYGIPETEMVPVSDGAGEVIEVGTNVRQWAIGDRVIGSCLPVWQSGKIPNNASEGALGVTGPGMLSEEVVLPESAWVRAPAHMSFVEAATLPCAGVTAWNALFGITPHEPTDWVLLQGTGGVSMWALSIAHAAGLRTVVTSSSEAKLDRARQLGATGVVRYADNPRWAEEARNLTGGDGFDRVLDVGGRDTSAASLAALRRGATIAVIGGLTGFESQVSSLQLIFGSYQMVGIYMGSTNHLRSLARFTEAHKIHPIVDQTFGFDEAPAAYKYLKSAQHIGKITISIDG